MRVFVATSCIPDYPYPCLPYVFATVEAADAHMDEMMRSEWEANGPENENGDRLPYPGDWREAQEAIAECDTEGAWGRWDVTAHDVLAPVPTLTPADLDQIAALLAAEVGNLTDNTDGPEVYDGEHDDTLARIADLNAIAAKVDTLRTAPGPAPADAITHLRAVLPYAESRAEDLEANADRVGPDCEISPLTAKAIAAVDAAKAFLDGIPSATPPAPSDAPADPVKAEMLAALKAIKAARDMPHYGDTDAALDHLHDAMPAVEAAIARAEGRV